MPGMTEEEEHGMTVEEEHGMTVEEEHGMTVGWLRLQIAFTTTGGKARPYSHV